MNRRLLVLALAALPAVPALAQVVEPRVHASGPFDSIVVTGAGQVRLFQADHDEVVVPGDKRVLEAVSVQQTGSVLTIRLPRDPNFLGALAQVEVHVNHLTHLTISDAGSLSAPLSFRSDVLAIRMAGTGLVAFDKLDVGQLAVDMAGTSQGRFAGKVDRLRLSASGTSRFVADHLCARSAEVTVAAAASADVWALGESDLRVSESGRIRYWGRPTVMSTIAGQGSIDFKGSR